MEPDNTGVNGKSCLDVFYPKFLANMVGGRRPGSIRLREDDLVNF